jgi:hypothetical protein
MRVLPPEHDLVVRGVVGVLRSVVGHVEEERVARTEALALVVEPGVERRVRRGPNHHVGDGRVAVLDGRME